MRISVRVKGGFAGLNETLGPLETTDLPAGTAGTIESALARLESALPAPGAGPVGADLITYEIVLERAGAERVIRVVDDGSAPAQLAQEVAEQVRAAG